MSAIRRFLLASSLARLIMRERRGYRIVEGHFPDSHQRRSYVYFEGEVCRLVLVTKPGTAAQEEERTEVSSKQGQFLMEVCAGSLAYERCSIELGGAVAQVDSFRIPARLSLIEVPFDAPDQASAFEPPIWFGPEVTGDDAFERNAIATHRLADQPEIAISDDAVHSVLDFLDRSISEQVPTQEETVMESLKEEEGEAPETTEESAPEASDDEQAGALPAGGETTASKERGIVDPLEEEIVSGIVEQFPRHSHDGSLRTVGKRQEKISSR